VTQVTNVDRRASDRLAHAADSGEISPQSGHELREALGPLSGLRICHQANPIEGGFAADNDLRPSSLSNFERAQLKGTFGVTKTPPGVLAQRYRNA